MIRVPETRQSLMLKAKDRGVKNFRVLNKDELQAVLAEGVTEERIDQVVSEAVTRQTLWICILWQKNKSHVCCVNPSFGVSALDGVFSIEYCY